MNYFATRRWMKRSCLFGRNVPSLFPKNSEKRWFVWQYCVQTSKLSWRWKFIFC